jgi:hypothetical protein
MRAGDQPTGRARDRGHAVARLRMQVAAGHPLDVPAGMSADARACLQVADGVGAPLLPVLDALADAEEQRARVARQVATAAAPARTVAVVLVCLPLVAVPLLARISGVDLLAFYRSGLGLTIGMIGVSLWAAGGAAVWLILRRGTDGAGTSVTVRALVPAAAIAIVLSPWLAIPAWLAARMVLRAAPRPPHPDLPTACDLVATGLSAGVSPAAALRLAADHVPALASDLRGLAWRLDLGREPPRCRRCDPARPGPGRRPGRRRTTHPCPARPGPGSPGRPGRPCRGRRPAAARTPDLPHQPAPAAGDGAPDRRTGRGQWPARRQRSLIMKEPPWRHI